jgi:hypothetical protein
VSTYAKVFVFQFLIESFGFTFLRFLAIVYRKEFAELNDYFKAQSSKIRKGFLKSFSISESVKEDDPNDDDFDRTSCLCLDGNSNHGLQREKPANVLQKDIVTVKVFTYLAISFTFGKTDEYIIISYPIISYPFLELNL